MMLMRDLLSRRSVIWISVIGDSECREGVEDHVRSVVGTVLIRFRLHTIGTSDLDRAFDESQVMLEVQQSRTEKLDLFICLLSILPKRLRKIDERGRKLEDLKYSLSYSRK